MHEIAIQIKPLCLELVHHLIIEVIIFGDSKILVEGVEKTLLEITRLSQVTIVHTRETVRHESWVYDIVLAFLVEGNERLWFVATHLAIVSLNDRLAREIGVKDNHCGRLSRPPRP